MPGRAPADEAAIAAAVRGLFDLPVAVAVTRPDAAYPPLMAREAETLTRARPARIAEFTAGRHAARQAMGALGLAPQRVLVGPDRAPIWPAGLVGSISHSAQWCIAVLARDSQCRALGLDIEDDSALPQDLVTEICSPEECAEAARHRHGAKAIFCAKEAAYKAQYPLTGVLFGFDGLALRVTSETAFDAQFTQATGGFSQGENLPGRIAWVAGHLVTGVAIGQIAPKGA